MGLYTGNTVDYYGGLETLGGYQFISITDIINNFRVAYVGEDKIIAKISRADIRFHAMRGLQELTYDTFKSCKTLELEVPPSLLLMLPHDYVNYVKISWVDSNGKCHTINECKACPKDPLAFIQHDGSDTKYEEGDIDIRELDANNNHIEPGWDDVGSDTWEKLSSSGTTTNNSSEEYPYQDNTGARFGLDPQHANTNGCFWINCRTGKIHFDSGLAGKTIIIQYISDSSAQDGEMLVHKFAEEAMYRHIAWAILNTRSNVDRNIVATYKKERFAAVRNAKIRLSNIKLEEITQILRGKSKWIKH